MLRCRDEWSNCLLVRLTMKVDFRRQGLFKKRWDLLSRSHYTRGSYSHNIMRMEKQAKNSGFFKVEDVVPLTDLGRRTLFSGDHIYFPGPCSHELYHNTPGFEKRSPKTLNGEDQPVCKQRADRSWRAGSSVLSMDRTISVQETIWTERAGTHKL